MHWLTKEWWEYLFAKPNRYAQEDRWWWVRVPVCRAKGHPAGVWWYNPGGFEPDMHCKNCGDDLG